MKKPNKNCQSKKNKKIKKLGKIFYKKKLFTKGQVRGDSKEN